MAREAADEARNGHGWSDEASGPVHVAQLLKREGHPLGADKGGIGKGRVFGVAAGAVLVAGAVVATSLGLGGGATSADVANSAQSGLDTQGDSPQIPVENPAYTPSGPYGTLPTDLTGQTQGTTPSGAPVVDENGQLVQPTSPQARPQPNTQTPPSQTTPGTGSGTGSGPTTPSKPSKPQKPTPPPPGSSTPAPPPSSSTPPPASSPAPTTLTDIVTPITGALDQTLQPALSLLDPLGGLFSHH